MDSLLRRYDSKFDKIRKSPYGSLIHLNEGTILYRANDVVEYELTANYCSDTGKRGLYFSGNSPYLAETMPTEYNKDMLISVCRVKKPITVITGKYAHRDLGNVNISHVEPEVVGMFSTIEPEEPYAEVFISSEDLDHIEFVMYYRFTVQQSIDKWGFHDWREDQ